MNADTGNRRLTLKQAAEHLADNGFAVTEEGLRSRVRRETVPFHRLPPHGEHGWSIWFLSDELDRWVQGRKVADRNSPHLEPEPKDSP